jgi:putative FmdB family regulatory protein
MPLYEYQCRNCDRPFEKYARTFNDRPDCPACGGPDVARLLSTFAVSTGRPVYGPSHPASPGSCGEGPPCGATHCGRLAN